MADPADDVVKGVALALATEVERRSDRFGWDLPPLMFLVRGADLPASHQSHLNSMIEASLTDADAPDPSVRLPAAYPTLSFGISEPLIVPGDPYDAVLGVHTPKEILAVVLAFETWHYSESTQQLINAGLPLSVIGNPSDQVDRLDVRMVYCLFRDGTEAFVRRDRGGDLIPMVSATLEGRLTWALRTMVGLPSGASTNLSPKEVTARAIEGAAMRIARLSDEEIAVSPLAVVVEFLDGEVNPTLLSMFTMLLVSPAASLIVGALSEIDTWDELPERLKGIPTSYIHDATEIQELLEVANWADPGFLFHHVADLVGVRSYNLDWQDDDYLFEPPIPQGALGEAALLICSDLASHFRNT